MRQTKRRLFVFFAVFVVVSLLAAGCGNSEEDTDQKADEQAGQAPEPLDTTSEEVIASYDGLTSGEVKEGEFNRFLNVVMTVNPQMAMFIEQEELKDQMLSQYIASKSIAPKVEATSEMEDEASELVESVKQQYEQMQGEDKQFAAYLEEQGFTEDDLHRFFVDNIKVEHYFNEEVTEEDLRDGYNRLKEEKDLRLYKAKVRHILIQENEERDDAAAKKRAEEVKQKLDSGEDFAELAKEYSDDPGSKESGGSLGDELTPLATAAGPTYVQSFGEAVRDLPLNEVSDPVKSDFGYHIIEVLEREQLEFEAAKDLVQADVWTKEYQHYVDNELKIEMKQS